MKFRIEQVDGGRDALVSTYAINDAMNQLILAHLDPKAWRAKLPGAQPGVRTIGAIFAHLHNVRLRWLKYNAPHLKRSAPLDPHRCTMKQTASALQKSGELCAKMLNEALSSDPNRQIKTFRRDSWMPVWTANPTMFSYMFGHEEHHRGQILMLAHQLGYRVDPAKIYPLWYWDKLWKQAGIRRPR
jgi:uncharacterized damage-inducible protein DinB